MKSGIKKISILEQKEVIDASVLAPIAIILKVPTEAIQYLDDDSAIRIIANTFSQQEESPSTTAQAIHYPPTFNPFDKMVELYERIIEQQQQTIDKLEQLIHKR
ncbi:hypothetical protein [Sphingobacterium populi]|uniref:hypothetical protein n=1 Tax=Sphingobacterium sp. CFCC 11742 TaxID=1775560 RepID=UPI0018D365CF|nr:hypothetical protein [Sphingobacterium sp. CFCC 11742]